MNEALETMPGVASRAQADAAQTVVELINRLDQLARGLDALLVLSVSEHLDPKASGALDFVHAGLDDLWGEAADLAHELLAALGAQREASRNV
ncbi:MAG: hypothetical protein RLZZ187_2142 [Pseudomonadota bacterium]|jgi:hypothetical protein